MALRVLSGLGVLIYCTLGHWQLLLPLERWAFIIQMLVWRVKTSILYSGKLSREKNSWIGEKIQFSRRKLSRIACFCCAKGRHTPNFVKKTLVYSHNTAEFAKVFHYTVFASCSFRLYLVQSLLRFRQLKHRAFTQYPLHWDRKVFEVTLLLFIKQMCKHNEMMFLICRNASKHIVLVLGVNCTAGNALKAKFTSVST